MAEPEPRVFVAELGESSVNFAVHFWHEAKIADMWKARDQLQRDVCRALGEAGITIPFPQFTVSLRDEASKPEPT